MFLEDNPADKVRGEKKVKEWLKEPRRDNQVPDNVRREDGSMGFGMVRRRGGLHQTMLDSLDI